MPTLEDPKPHLEDVPEDLDHSSMYDRIMHGTAVGRVLEKAWSSAKEGLGGGEHGEGFGFQPGSDMTKLMQDMALFRDPEKPRMVDPISVATESLIKVPTALADLGMHTINAGIYGVSGATAQTIGELTGQNESQIERGKNDIAMMIQLGLMHAGENPAAPLSRVRHLPDGTAITEPIGNLPRIEDFKPTADAIRRMVGHSERTAAEIEPELQQARQLSADFAPQALADPAQYGRQAAQLEATVSALERELSGTRVGPEVLPDKLRGLYEQYGIHPAEVLNDAHGDPMLAKDLASDSPILPPKYTGLDPLKMIADQRARDAAADKPVRRIEGISPELDDALHSRVAWPETPEAATGGDPARTLSMRIGDHVGRVVDRVGFGVSGILRDLQMKVTPMAERLAPIEARAAAKDFANTLRVARYDGQLIHALLTKEFSRERLEAMWNAVDKADAARVMGGDPGPALARLTATERQVVNALRDRMRETYEEAYDLKMHRDKEGGREFYVPRMISYARNPGGEGAKLALNVIGKNLRTRTNQLLRRFYDFSQHTEEAAKKALGEDAFMVRDIRTLNLANSRLQEAIVGRKLIEAIKKIGEDLPDPAVVEGVPEGSGLRNYFTLDHPAFYSTRPLMVRTTGGQYQRALTVDGKPAFERVPLHVHGAFEGPLRAVLTQPEGAAYRAVMDIKGRAMSLVMFSPLLHNAVIFGRALPATMGNPFTLVRLYFSGNRVKNDPVQMTQAIGNGLVPIGRNGYKFDLTSITEDANMEPGRSITSKLLGFVPGLFDAGAGKAVKTAVDKAGDFWHNTLLWDRVADIQMGLYKHFREDLIDKGVDPDVATKVAAHFGNRYAGVLSPEAMSPAARKISNIMMFSRSYTLGNLGAMKDMFVGMPRDMLAQIERDLGPGGFESVRSYAQRKAIGIVAVDMALFYAGNSVVQSVLEMLRGEKTIDEEAKGYVERFQKALKANLQNPYYAFNPFKFMSSVSSTGENEPGKEDKILVGYQSDGTAIYVKNPTGKTGEEMIGWMTKPAEMVRNKLSTLIRPAQELFYNRDYAGKHIYNPYPDTPEKVVRNVAAMVWHFMKAQVPSDTIESAVELLTGTPTSDEAKLDTAKIVGGLAGLMFSKGFPGGPAGGELFRAKQERQFAIDQTLPTARKLIREGRIGEAQELMSEVKIDQRLQQFFIQTTQNPSASFAKKRAQQLISSLPAEEQERINMQLGKGKNPGN